MSGTRLDFRHAGVGYGLEVHRHPDHLVCHRGEGAATRIDLLADDAEGLVLRVGDSLVGGAVRVTSERVFVSYEGRNWILERARGSGGSGAASEEAVAGEILAPMTGTVLEVHCAPGDAVQTGMALVTVEAMKMEHRLNAPADATVLEVSIAAGDQVDIGQVLIRLEPAS